MKYLGSAFGDHNLGELKKDIIRIKERLKDQALWSESIEDRR